MISSVRFRGLGRASSYLVALVGLTLLLSGCNGGGSVVVDVGQPPAAQAFQVDLYADEPTGLGVVEGKYFRAGELQEVTLDDIEPGRWALLIQAQDPYLNTLYHYQAKLEVREDQTTRITAGTYRPGLPGDPIPEAEATLTTFGPNGDALLTATYGPASDGMPGASVNLEIASGEGEAEEAEAEVVARGFGPQVGSAQCGTCFISDSDVARANRIVAQEVRPQVGTVAPGETRDFFVVTSFQTVTCQRLLNDSQTQHCLIFAEEVGGTPVISEATALAIAQAFDQDNPFQEGEVGIYEQTRQRFGSEWKVNGGRDGDERVVLVFLSSGSIGGEGLFGFVNPADERPKSESSSSNEGEIMYLNADRATASLYDGVGTLSHELVHLIVLNQKVVQDGTFPEGASPENAVLDEGLAVLNEELCGFGYSGPQGGNFFLLSALSNLLTEGFNRAYFSFGGKLSDYGAGYLFWRFLHDQEGIETITTIVDNPATGRANIEAVLQEPFSDFFARYTQAVALNDQPDLPLELQFTNLDLFSAYTATDGQTFDLNGLQGVRAVTLPGTLSVEDTLQPWGTIFYRASGGDGSALTLKATGVAELFTRALGLTNATE